MKLFSGDDKGRVVFSSLDLDQVSPPDPRRLTDGLRRRSKRSHSRWCCCLHEQGVCNPILLLEETSGVVQMEYSHQLLLVSTQQRSLLYCTQKEEVQQLGTKPRKR